MTGVIYVWCRRAGTVFLVPPPCRVGTILAGSLCQWTIVHILWPATQLLLCNWVGPISKIKYNIINTWCRRLCPLPALMAWCGTVVWHLGLFSRQGTAGYQPSATVLMLLSSGISVKAQRVVVGYGRNVVSVWKWVEAHCWVRTSKWRWAPSPYVTEHYWPGPYILLFVVLFLCKTLWPAVVLYCI